MGMTVVKTWIKCRLCLKRRKVALGSASHRDTLCWDCVNSERARVQREAREEAQRKLREAIQAEMNAAMEQFESLNLYADALKRREQPTFRMSDDDGRIVYVTRGSAPGKARCTIRVSGLSVDGAITLLQAADVLETGADLDELRDLQKLNLVELMRQTGNAIQVTYAERAMAVIDTLFGR